MNVSGKIIDITRVGSKMLFHLDNDQRFELPDYKYDGLMQKFHGLIGKKIKFDGTLFEVVE